MKLVSNIVDNIKVPFKDLEIGAAYFNVADGDEVFCIKLNDTECLFHTTDDRWEVDLEVPHERVVPLDVTITINGYREFY